MSSKRQTLMAANSNYGGIAVAGNDDLLTEILVRVPAEYVTRLKLVCKRWLSLISDHQFRRLHKFRHHNPQPSLILRTRTEQFFYLSSIINGGKPMIPYRFSVPNPKILSSSNGLLLLQSDNPDRDYYVYNPITRQSRKIDFDYESEYPAIMSLNIAYDPPHYKIVCVRASLKGCPGPRSYQVKVYDSLSQTWKPCLDESFIVADKNLSCGVHCDNSIYWKTSDALLSFDMDENVIKSLPFPEIPWPEHSENGVMAFHFSQLQESNGHLYLFTIGPILQSFALWELQGDGSSQSWFLKYHDLSPWLVTECASLLRFISGSDGEETAMVTHVPGKIRIYRFHDKSVEELVDFTDQPFYHQRSLQFDSENVYQFDPSLALFD